MPVAVVIVTWNSDEYVGPCLESLDALERSPEEIVVVDNGSRDRTLEIVRAAAPEARVLALETNTGFCHAANAGIASTRSPFVLLLNPDTRLTPRFLEELMPAFDDPKVGLAGGKLLRFDGVTIDTAGQSLGRSRQPIDRGYGTLDRGQFDHDAEVFGICGAAVVYRREMIEHVSRSTGEFFDEAFFAFYEDLDVAWRARRLGWRAAYRHRAVGHHRRSSTAEGTDAPRRGSAMLRRSPELRYHIIKNRHLTMLRNDAVGDWIANLPWILSRDLTTLALLLVGSPAVLVRLASSSTLVGRALHRRRADRARRA